VPFSPADIEKKAHTAAFFVHRVISSPVEPIPSSIVSSTVKQLLSTTSELEKSKLKSQYLCRFLVAPKRITPLIV
jgi:hypothetical protein